jgi:hypothetical protein
MPASLDRAFVRRATVIRRASRLGERIPFNDREVIAMKHQDAATVPNKEGSAAPVSVDSMREAQPSQKLPKAPKPRKTERRRRGRKS